MYRSRTPAPTYTRTANTQGNRNVYRSRFIPKQSHDLYTYTFSNSLWLEELEKWNFWRKKEKEQPALLTRTCPPGPALAGPDISEFRLLVQFRTFRVQNLLFDVISRWFCMVLRGEAQKTRFWYKKPNKLQTNSKIH